MLMPCIAPLYTAGGSSSTAWDLTSPTFVQSFSVSSQVASAQGLTFSPDGTVMVVAGANGYVYTYTLSSGYDISTASYVTSYNATAETTASTDVQFNDDGTKMYIAGGTNVYQYTLGTPYDISTASYASKTYNFTTQSTAPSGVFFKNDGTVMFMCGSDNRTIFQYSLSTAWDVSTASYASLSKVFVGNTLNGIFVGKNGLKMYCAREDAVAPIGDTKVYEYDLGVAWSLSGSFTLVNQPDVAAKEEDLKGVFFKSDGTKFYIVGPWSDSVHEYNC